MMWRERVCAHRACATGHYHSASASPDRGLRERTQSSRDVRLVAGASVTLEGDLVLSSLALSPALFQFDVRIVPAPDRPNRRGPASAVILGATLQLQPAARARVCLGLRRATARQGFFCGTNPTQGQDRNPVEQTQRRAKTRIPRNKPNAGSKPESRGTNPTQGQDPNPAEQTQRRVKTGIPRNKPNAGSRPESRGTNPTQGQDPNPAEQTQTAADRPRRCRLSRSRSPALAISQNPMPAHARPFPCVFHCH